jgi:CBS domain-containing protein
MLRDVYKPLKPVPLKSGSTCRRPNEYPSIAVDSPAIDAMTDFQRVAPVTIGADATLTRATNQMVSRSVRLLFVVDDDEAIIGVITARDTMGERPIKLLQERGGKHGDLKVADVMTPVAQLEGFPLNDVLHAEVGHILATLKQIGRQHALVVEWDPVTQRNEVRGMFSATAIGRHLGVPIQTFEIANTFAEIEAALAST